MPALLISFRARVFGTSTVIKAGGSPAHLARARERHEDLLWFGIHFGEAICIMRGMIFFLRATVRRGFSRWH